MNTLRTWKLFSRTLDANIFLPSSEYSEAQGLYVISVVQIADIGVRNKKKKVFVGESVDENKQGQPENFSNSYEVSNSCGRWRELKKMKMCTKITSKLTVIAEKADEVEKQIWNLTAVLLDQLPGQALWSSMNISRFSIPWTWRRICSPFQKIICTHFFFPFEREWLSNVDEMQVQQ